MWNWSIFSGFDVTVGFLVVGFFCSLVLSSVFGLLAQEIHYCGLLLLLLYSSTLVFLPVLACSINRKPSHIELDIYRKPTPMDIIIHFSSNHPYDHKLAEFRYYITRMITLPITEQARKQEWRNIIIIIIAHNNGFPEPIIQKLRTKLTNKRNQPQGTQQSHQNPKKWISFTYYGPTIRKITNLFKHTNLQIAFRPTNTTYQQLSQRRNNNSKPSGIY